MRNRKSFSRYRFIFLLPIVLGLPGCVSRIAEFREVAGAGVEAATKVETAIRTTRSQYAESRRIISFKQAFIEKSDRRTLPSDEDYKGTLKAIGARANLARELLKTYRSFKSLADYNAQAEFEGAAEELVGAVNEFSGAQAKKKIVSPKQGEIFQIALGFLGEQLQVSRLKDANTELLRILKPLHQFMVDERVAYVSILQLNSNTRYNVTRALWKANLLDAREIVSEMIKGTKLRLREGRFIADSDPKLKGAVIADIDLARDEASEALGAAFQEETNALKDLIDLHEDLAADKPIDMSDLGATLERLLGWIERVNQAGK